MPLSKSVAVIGVGPAGLMAAEVLATGGANVTVYERMPSAGRKFLLAGRGGLNLTHSEHIDAFLSRYGSVWPRLQKSIEEFSPAALRNWSEGLGQETFVGSSGRVFPKSFKSSPLLRAWLRSLDAGGVKFALRHEWLGWNDAGSLRFRAPSGEVAIDADATVLSLGGASWPRLGSDGGWANILSGAGVEISPLKPANCGFLVQWSGVFRGRFEGHALKRIELSFAGHRAKGEATITRSGIEGGAVYALSGSLRDEILASGKATLNISLLPDIVQAELERRLSVPRGKQSFANFLRKSVHFSLPAIGLLQEAFIGTGNRLSDLTPRALAELIQAVPVKLTGVAPIETAISTAGGISFSELDENFMLRRRPGVFAAGEMLDWEAPTGGYLLQAAFSTGAAAARGVLKWLER